MKSRRKIKKTNTSFSENIGELLTSESDLDIKRRQKLLRRASERDAKKGNFKSANQAIHASNSKGQIFKCREIYKPQVTRVKAVTYYFFEDICSQRKITKQEGMSEALEQWISFNRDFQVSNKNIFQCAVLVQDKLITLKLCEELGVFCSEKKVIGEYCSLVFARGKTSIEIWIRVIKILHSLGGIFSK